MRLTMEQLYAIIIAKRDSALREREVYKNSLYEYQELKGEIEAYNDILTLIENSKNER